MSGVTMSKEKVLETAEAVKALVQNEALNRIRLDRLEAFALEMTQRDLKGRLRWLLTGK